MPQKINFSLFVLNGKLFFTIGIRTSGGTSQVLGRYALGLKENKANCLKFLYSQSETKNLY